MVCRPADPPRCEYPECTKPAECTVSGQWTVADFIEYWTCAEHQPDAWDTIAHTFVEGLPVAELTTTWWDPLE